MALTAALWSWKLCSGVGFMSCQTSRRLSLPPDASCRPSGDQRRPHTSCRCASSRCSQDMDDRTSKCTIDRARDPAERMLPFHARQPRVGRRETSAYCTGERGATDPWPKKWRRTDAHALLVVPAHDLGPVNVPNHNIAALRAYGQVCSLVDVRLQARVLNACERRVTLQP